MNSTSDDESTPTLATLWPLLLKAVREHGYERRDEPFRLSSGGMSHDYVDMRRAVASGDVLRIAAEAVIGAVADEGIEFDLIGGMTMGADPVAHAVALLTKRAWFSVRKAEKDHGTGRRIEGGEISDRSRVLLFEDTVSTGRSILEARDVILETGARVVGACTILDRGDDLAPVFRELQVAYVPLLTYKDLSIEPITSDRGDSKDTPEPPRR